ncbi:MAG: ABC transporter substrate-binding protein [Acidimicrobiales bacterium]
MSQTVSRRRIAVIVLMVLSLVAAACGDDAASTNDETTTTTAEPDATTTEPGESSTTTPPETTGSVPLTASFRGVTEDTIKVGVMAYDFDRLADIGVDLGVSNSGDLYVAALEAINDRGGIHGRMLEAVITEFLPVGSTEADEACVRLTEDEEVFVVVGTTLNEQILCVTDLHETAAVVAAGMNEERLSRARAPYVTVGATQADRAAMFLDLMTDAGILDGQNVGVIGSVDVSETNFRTIVEAFRTAGYDPVEGLIGGNAEDLTESAREQGIIYQRMDEAGVEIAVSTTGIPLEIANAYDAGYEPEQWLLATSMSGRGLTSEGVPHDYLDGAYSVNDTPVGTTGQPTMDDDPLVATCIDDLRERTDHELPYSLDVPVNNILSALYACSIATILETAMTAAGPDLTNDSFQAGLETMGAFQLPGFGDATLGPDDYGASTSLTPVRFDASTGTWVPLDG